jgi:hypothetical protein
MTKVNKLEKDQFEILTEVHDIYITKGNKKFVVDIFDSKTEKNDKAHLDTMDFPTLKAAKAMLIEDYDLTVDILERIIFE